MVPSYSATPAPRRRRWHIDADPTDGSGRTPGDDALCCRRCCPSAAIPTTLDNSASALSRAVTPTPARRADHQRFEVGLVARPGDAVVIGAVAPVPPTPSRARRRCVAPQGWRTSPRTARRTVTFSAAGSPVRRCRHVLARVDQVHVGAGLRLARAEATRAADRRTWRRQRAGLRRPRPHLRQVRPDHRVQPRRVRRTAGREFRSLLDRVPPADTDEVHKLFVEELGDEPAQPVQDVRRGTVRVGVDRAGALRDPAHRRGGRRQDPATRHPPPRRRRPADPQARRAARSSWPSWAGGCPRRTSSPTSPTTSPRSWTSASRRSRWTPGWRTCTLRRWARTSGCRRCTGI